MKTIIRLLTILGLLVVGTGSRALACAACFNANAGSRMGNAANWAIIAMVFIMFGMLGTIVAAGFYLNWRAKNPLPDYNELLAEDQSSSDALPDAS